MPHIHSPTITNTSLSTISTSHPSRLSKEQHQTHLLPAINSTTKSKSLPLRKSVHSCSTMISILLSISPIYPISSSPSKSSLNHDNTTSIHTHLFIYLFKVSLILTQILLLLSNSSDPKLPPCKKMAQVASQSLLLSKNGTMTFTHLVKKSYSKSLLSSPYYTRILNILHLSH